MKVCRQTDARFRMLWELLRHEEITDLADLATIRRRMWAGVRP